MNGTASIHHRPTADFDQQSCQQYVGKQVIRNNVSTFKVNRVDQPNDRIVCQRLIFGRPIPALVWQPRVSDFMALVEEGELKIKPAPTS